MDIDNSWITVEEICKYLKVSNETVYRWIDKQNMPAHRVGRRWMFKIDEIDTWVRAGQAAESRE